MANLTRTKTSKLRRKEGNFSQNDYFKLQFKSKLEYISICCSLSQLPPSNISATTPLRPNIVFSLIYLSVFKFSNKQHFFSKYEMKIWFLLSVASNCASMFQEFIREKANYDIHLSIYMIRIILLLSVAVHALNILLISGIFLRRWKLEISLSVPLIGWNDGKDRFLIYHIE